MNKSTKLPLLALGLLATGCTTQQKALKPSTEKITPFKKAQKQNTDTITIRPKAPKTGTYEVGSYKIGQDLTVTQQANGVQTLLIKGDRKDALLTLNKDGSGDIYNAKDLTEHVTDIFPYIEIVINGYTLQIMPNENNDINKTIGATHTIKFISQE